MYSRRVWASSRALVQLRQRAAARGGAGQVHTPAAAAYVPAWSPPCDYSRSFRQATPSTVSIRHFGTGKGSEDDKDKEKDRKGGGEAVVANKKSSKTTDYKKLALDMVRSGARSTYLFFRHPTLIPGKLRHTWQVIKEEAHHYYLGFKLLIADVRTAKDILFRILEGHSMTRRERLQLMRTVTDLARLVPFSIFILIPFMELLLPVAIKMFPNMLPSTFEDSLKKEENLKNELNMRLSMASFFIDTITSMAEHKKKKSKAKAKSGGEAGEKDQDREASEDSASATELIAFMEKARMGEPLPHEAVMRIARLFKDELTLANMPRPQLVTMCQFMNLQPFGSDTFLRFQLRTKLTSIKEDDKRIVWEGVDSLTTQELQDACRERGMRATGLNTFGYRKQMREWLDLSMSKHTPISLLIMSRAFVLNLSAENRQRGYEESLQTSISSMDEDVVNEVIVQSASAKEVNTADMRKRKLESLQFQNEMIKEELHTAKEYLRKQQQSKEQQSKGEETTMQDATEKSSVIGIGDEHLMSVERVHDIHPSSSALEDSIPQAENIPFDLKFIHMTEGSKFDGGEVCMELDQPFSAPSLSTEEVALAKHKSGAPLTASEVQALGDMALQSAVEREKVELAKLKSQIKELKLERKIKKEKEEAAGGEQKVSDSAPASVANADVLTSFEQEEQAKKQKQGSSGEGIGREVSQKVKEEDLVYQEDSSQLTPPIESSADASPALTDEEKEEMKRMQSQVDGIMERLEDRLLKAENVSSASVDTEFKEEGKKPVEDEEEEDDEDDEEDVSLMRMKSQVDGMMARLEHRLTQTESALGDKLHKLDVNRDGVLDADELKAAVLQLLRRHSASKADEHASKEAVQEAADLIALLDQDNDGRITVKELMEYVASRDVLSEQESKMFESQKPKDRPPSKEE